MGKKLFFPLQLKPISIMQLLLHVDWLIEKINQSTAVASEPMAFQPAVARQNGRGVWLYNQLL